MTDAPRRRGRPPRTTADPVDTTIVTQEAGPEVKPRRRRASVGGFHLKLSAPAREGYHRHWFNDTPGRIANAEELAYDHVHDPSIKSDSTDTRVRRLVGTQANGQPLYSYLMETPLEEYQRGQDEREEGHRQIDKAICEGRDATGRIENQYGEGSISAR